MGFKRVVLWGITALALYFAVQGGEYSTIDLVRQRSRARMLAHVIDSLQHDVDSLARLKQLILNDPATQERIAREDYGMVRGDHELLYRFVAPDSVAKTRR
jgi:cell division protein FtsB